MNLTKTLLLVGLGGGIGSVFRYLIGLYVHKYLPVLFPWGTFLINVTGCFLIGLFMGMLDRGHWTAPDLKFFLVVGICGGFTTFSAFSIEGLHLLQNQQTLLAFSYITSSVVLGLLATCLGLYLIK
jgi:CrcB protein